jgi:hypothetical protein
MWEYLNYLFAFLGLVIVFVFKSLKEKTKRARYAALINLGGNA